MLDYPSVSRNPDPEISILFDKAKKRFDSGIVDSMTRDLFIIASEKGCTDAMVMLGNIYIDGSEEEKTRSLDLFIKAAELGNDSAMRNVAYSYALGLGCEKDKVKAAEWYEKAARAGNAKAQCNLGVLYAYGHGVPKDMGKAAEWYRASAENGYFRGQTNYGELLLAGDGVEQDYTEAAKWFRCSGSNRALYKLAGMYIEGKGVPTDVTEAEELLRKASDKGYAKAMVLLASIVGKHSEEYLNLISMAASKGNTDAIEILEQKGIHVPEYSRKMKRSK